MTTASAHRRSRRRLRLAGPFLALTLLLATVGAGAAQPATPEPADTGTDESITAPAAELIGLAGAPQPAVSQGLVYLDGQDVWWQVREVDLVAPAASTPSTGNTRFIIQRSGSSVIRNDITGKRALLDVHESYFASAGDPYTSMAADGSPSTVWSVEIANNDAVGEGAFYLSPAVGGVAEATYDLELTRTVLEPGTSTAFTSGGEPFLVLVLSGQIVVNDGTSEATLVEAEARSVQSNVTIIADGDGTAVYMVASLGQTVSDSSVGTPIGPTVATDPIDPAALPAVISDALTPSDGGSAAPASAPTTSEPAPRTDAGFVTSIAVRAAAPIGVTIIADGVTVFDGWLETGDWTGYLTGTAFEVYTTSGVNTDFTNSCSEEPFKMGFEEGDASYVLQAGPQSCAPID